MSRTVTIAVFANPMDIKMNLFKDMLEQAGINYLVVNENFGQFRAANPVIGGNIGIEIRVEEEDAPAAIEIFNSIE